MIDQLKNQLTQLQAQRGNLAKGVEQLDKEIEKVGFALQALEAVEKEQEPTDQE